jgi:phage shock protein C
MIGGVAAGIANSLNTDASIIRLIFILMAVFGGGGVILYLILWIVLPEDDISYYTAAQSSAPAPDAGVEAAPSPQPEAPPQVQVPQRKDGSLVAGAILIFLGGALLIARLIPRLDFWNFWPVLFIIVGLVIIIAGFAGSKRY